MKGDKSTGILSPPPAHVMIVDDTPVNLRLLEELLDRAGFKVSAFPSGDLALRAAVRRPPDLILLDILMPEMDGYEVCRLLKASESLRHIPIIFISALNATGDKIRAFSRGGVDYVTKPFHEAEVLARVQAQVELVSLRRQLKEQNEKLEELVSARTRELARANKRLSELAAVKGDFLAMISHEIRTPANGVLGIGELLLANETQGEFRDIFEQSSRRLRDLIDDASLIGEMEKLSDMGSGHTVMLSDLLADLEEAEPDLCVLVDERLSAQEIVVHAERALLGRSLKTLVELARYFCRENPLLDVQTDTGVGTIFFRFELTHFHLEPSQAAEFFRLESKVRSATIAEPLGLAPVVAEKLIRISGGTLQLYKGAGEIGRLEAAIPCSRGGRETLRDRTHAMVASAASVTS